MVNVHSEWHAPTHAWDCPTGTHIVNLLFIFIPLKNYTI